MRKLKIEYEKYECIIVDQYETIKAMEYVVNECIEVCDDEENNIK